MDIARPTASRRRRLRRAAASLAVAGGLGLVTLAVTRLAPAAPRVDRSTLWIDEVKRGPMLREVRGVGALVAEDTRWIPATTTGRVERIHLRPGTPVEADTVILELTNPTLEQEMADATLRVTAAEAGLVSLRAQLANDALALEAIAANMAAEYEKAALQASVQRQLADRQLVSAIVVQQAMLDATQLEARLAIARRQLASGIEAQQSRLAVQQTEVDQARAMVRLRRHQVDDLKVRARFTGVLQVVPVEVGQQVAPGTNLARVANPTRLKAEVRVVETQARDIQVGLRATIDTRNGLVDGVVTRIDPAVQNGTVTVDIAVHGNLPRGARPDLTVDGTIELERLADVLYVGRPAFGQEQSAAGLFRLAPDGSATRVPVRFGRASVNTVEVISGVQAGDQVILSDMSAWDGLDRVRVQ